MKKEYTYFVILKIPIIIKKLDYYPNRNFTRYFNNISNVLNSKCNDGTNKVVDTVPAISDVCLILKSRNRIYIIYFHNCDLPAYKNIFSAHF